MPTLRSDTVPQQVSDSKIVPAEDLLLQQQMHLRILIPGVLPGTSSNLGLWTEIFIKVEVSLEVVLQFRWKESSLNAPSLFMP